MRRASPRTLARETTRGMVRGAEHGIVGHHSLSVPAQRGQERAGGGLLRPNGRRTRVAIHAESAGTDPAAQPSPAVVATLRADGIDVAGYRPRLVTAEDVAGAHRVISLGCNLDDLPRSSARLERWDDIPPVSEDLKIRTSAIRRHVEILLDDLAGEALPSPTRT